MTSVRDQAPAADAPLPGMIGKHPLMREVYRLVRLVAPTDLSVVVDGETGTGKELVARALHELSPRAQSAFVDINCTALPEHLVEAELFGWERGAFTGAHQTMPGLLERANGGTLFLDEACGLPRAVQAKMLRAIERREHRRVGGRTTIASDFRLILATARSIQELMDDGAFREDFAFRIHGLSISLPALRARGRDVQLLAEAFLRSEQRTVRLVWDEDALESLAQQKWTGNVRELQMLVRRLALLAQDARIDSAAVVAALGLRSNVLSREELAAAFAVSGGNISGLARTLKQARNTLRDRLTREGILSPR